MESDTLKSDSNLKENNEDKENEEFSNLISEKESQLSNHVEKNDTDDGSSILTPFDEEDSEESEIDENKIFIEQIQRYLDEAGPIQYDELKIPSNEEESNPYSEYEKNCHKYGVFPIIALKDILQGVKKELDLQSRRIKDINLFLICQTLIGPPASSIQHINLKNTSINEKGCIALSELLEMNSNLEILNLENCEIGPECIKLLSDGIYFSRGILHLNLSKCNLKDSDGVLIVKALSKNDVCKFVDLSHNKLHTQTANELSNTFRENFTLEVLNLSWNEFYPENDASVKLMKGLLVNESLQQLDLSWNGISGNQFAKLLVKVLRQNKSLRILNLENNYLTPEDIKLIAVGIKNSIALEEIYIGGNYVTSEEHLRLIKSAKESKCLKILSLGEHKWLEKNVFNLAASTMEKKPSLNIVSRGVFHANPPEPVNFKDILIDRAKYLTMNTKKKKLRKDLGHFMLQLLNNENDTLKEEEFIELIRKSKLQLDKDLIMQIIDEFSKKQEKKPLKKRIKVPKLVQIKELANYYLKKYPTEPPPPKVKKRKRKKNKNEKPKDKFGKK